MKKCPSSIQYRDSNLVETNEDSTSDQFGQFFASLLDLESGIELAATGPNSDLRNLNETVVLEERNVDILPIEVAEEEEDMEEEEQVSRLNFFNEYLRIRALPDLFRIFGENTRQGNSENQTFKLGKHLCNLW